jgi:hypothetical protein
MAAILGTEEDLPSGRTQIKLPSQNRLSKHERRYHAVWWVIIFRLLQVELYIERSCKTQLSATYFRLQWISYCAVASHTSLELPTVLMHLASQDRKL